MDELRLGDPWLAAQLGHHLAEARGLVGWSQRELAERAEVSQAAISRLEAGSGAVIDLAVVERVLVALGMRGTLTIDAPHLRDRVRQRDPVHARLVGYAARRLRRVGWEVATEVPIGEPVPKGWIDLLAFRAVDGAGLIGEAKADLPDIGDLLRQVGFYGRAGASAARSLGWRFERTAVAVLALDSVAIADRVRANRDLLRHAFPGSPATLDAWFRSSAADPPERPTLALVDPMSRRSRWLRPAIQDGRRLLVPYRDYADAALRLRANQPGGARLGGL